jgi:hypothetical protein
LLTIHSFLFAIRRRWYISAAGVIRHEDLMKRGPLVASIALLALAAQQAAQA